MAVARQPLRLEKKIYNIWERGAAFFLRRLFYEKDRRAMTASAKESQEDFVDSLEDDWHRKKPAFETRGTAVVARIVRLNYYIEKRLARNLSRFSLSRGEFEVLSVLLRHTEDSVTPKFIQSKVLVTSGGLSNRIRTLEEKGFLRRGGDERDGRGVILTLTSEGRAVAARAAASHIETEGEILQGMPEKDIDELTRLLRKLTLLQEHRNV